MNEKDRAELDHLKRRQESLQHQVAQLTGQIEQLHSRVKASAAPPVAELTSLEIPPLEIISAQETDQRQDAIPSAVPPPLPPVISTVPEPAVVLSAVQTPNLTPPAEAPSDATAPFAQNEPPARSFEIQVGTYWLVRVGIVMLLTGLVFLGTYAYRNFIGLIGAPGKVALLYVAGAALLGAGAWLQRKREKESLRNYGQVLFAGGLAAVYFTTYAAHYVEVLRVIASPFVDGVLLLAWAGFIAWTADRKKSEVLALFAVGLAYYTSAITDVRLFTLYSNLVLTLAAVFFLIRNRWITLSFIGVAATYGGFAFWRFHHGDWSWSARVELWPANCFLAGYWLAFTAAVFLSRSNNLMRGTRALFASLNNGAFFGLVLLSMIHTEHWAFWKFSLGFGATLLCAAAAARKFLANEPQMKNTYLAQGIVLATAGLIAYFTGLKLALVLAAESVILAVLGRQFGNLFMRFGGGITAALSLCWTVFHLRQSEGEWFLGTAVGALLLFNSWWEHRKESLPEGWVARPVTSYFAGATLLTWGAVMWLRVPVFWVPFAFASGAMLFTFSYRALRVSEWALLGQSFAVVAQCSWLFQTLQRSPTLPWWISVTVIGSTVLLSHWWQRQRQFDVGSDVRNFFQVLYSAAAIAILFFWFQPKFTPSSWLVFANLLAVGVTIYGVLTRAWILTAFAQAFLLVSSWEFVRQLIDGKPAWYVALAPIATWLLLGTMTAMWLSRQPNATASVAKPVFQASVFYRWVAFGMSLWWVQSYFAARDYFWILCAAGIVLIAIAWLWRSRRALTFGSAYLAFACPLFLIQLLNSTAAIHWLNLLALLMLVAVQHAVRRSGERLNLPASVQEIAIVIIGASLWLFLSRWVVLKSGGAHFYLTASWAALAFLLFAGGFLLRERMYRWLGLAILACAVGRVFLFDVWKLETVYRILSFMALGIVLLVLGFIYNKYQEKIRQWL